MKRDGLKAGGHSQSPTKSISRRIQRASVLRLQLALSVELKPARRSPLALMGPVITYKLAGGLPARDLRNRQANAPSWCAGGAAGVAGGVCWEGCRPGRLAHLRLGPRLDPIRSLKGAAMADLKNSRAQSRLEKAAREGGNGWVGYEAEAKAVREKTARLKALRIAREAADKTAAAVDESAAARKPATKRAVKLGGAPPMTADRSKGGRRD
jgi:hypothetical protein